MQSNSTVRRLHVTAISPKIDNTQLGTNYATLGMDFVCVCMCACVSLFVSLLFVFFDQLLTVN